MLVNLPLLWIKLYDQLSQAQQSASLFLILKCPICPITSSLIVLSSRLYKTLRVTIKHKILYVVTRKNTTFHISLQAFYIAWRYLQRGCWETHFKMSLFLKLYACANNSPKWLLKHLYILVIAHKIPNEVL